MNARHRNALQALAVRLDREIAEGRFMSTISRTEMRAIVAAWSDTVHASLTTFAVETYDANLKKALEIKP